MTLTLENLRELAQQLPELTFSPEQDCDWRNNELEQAYLDFYGINFAKEFAEIEHAFGCVTIHGFKIATHYWLPTNAKGTLVVVHGYYDHVGLYGNPIRFALEHQLAVVAFDLPGHGLSSGEPATIESFNHYADVLANILQQSSGMLPRPIYALGQSTGCAVLLNYLWRYASIKRSSVQFFKIVLCSPLVLPLGWRGLGSGKYVYAVLRHFIQRINRTFVHSSHDQDFNQFIKEQDLLQARHLPLLWVGAMKAWHEMLLTFAPLPDDVLIIQGTGDMTVDWRYNLPVLQQKLTNSTQLLITDARHHMVNESKIYRDQIFTAVRQYFFN